ncbi:hypothetical protein WICMUC_005703 [Wickerhamomyces mucosus]|uniref:Vacuolar protein sorting-associated protein 29 n=1 Tax=Wickerhamomyces mucosus TaxID=1378264 RepID=A0A9P8P737_9ASCO|nr:hypothetical protein WICMUC_005703 [Wickerhamomyces mucosus]
MLVLAIGDLHIPHRSLKKLLTPGKISQVLCLGNVTSSPSTLEFLQNISPDFQLVKGEFDENTGLPLSLVITHGSLRIGFTNGYTVVPRNDPLSLLTLARQLNADVLIWGSSHKVEAYTLEGKFFINPGSATGAFSTEWPDLDEFEESREEVKQAETLQNGNKEDSGNDEALAAKTEELDINDNGNENSTDKDGYDGEHIHPKEQDRPVHSVSDDEEEEDGDDDDLYSTIPSFTLLDIQGTTITLYIYTYINGEVKVDKVSYRKPLDED